MTASLILMTNNFPSHIAALKKVRYAPYFDGVYPEPARVVEGSKGSAKVPHALCPMHVGNLIFLKKAICFWFQRYCSNVQTVNSQP